MRVDDKENLMKVYVDVEAVFTRDGFLKPKYVVWEDGRRYNIDKIRSCRRAASTDAGGIGIMYICMVSGREVRLFYEENYRWFVCRAAPPPENSA
ncbi:hypothetical protein [Butyrivibrio sp. MC2013]|uniref:hypothetical protein n=1 Tax=Butyrivibrio sp. MC2013 TaxID=1280686 RepID=UPI000415AA2A|nr:hypothetical protein [Butyrivibrio sp. MC2013]